MTDRCVTCGSKIDDPYECVNWLLWEGKPVPVNRNEVVRNLLAGPAHTVVFIEGDNGHTSGHMWEQQAR